MEEERGEMFPFERLNAWQKGIGYVEELLKLADRVKDVDRFSLGDQLKRAGISITNNIAEGGGRKSRKEKVYFYTISKGSVYEVVNLLELYKRRGYLSLDEHNGFYVKAEELAKMLSGLINSQR
jgi:four helix bundle protein